MNTQKIILSVLLVLIGGAGGYVLGHSQGTNQSAGDTQMAAATTTPKEFDLVVKDGKIVSGEGDIQVHQGDTVKLVVTNDSDNELHLHGYNIMTDLKANEPGTITFEASASGRFPFELEDTKQDLGAISVLPR